MICSYCNCKCVILIKLRIIIIIRPFFRTSNDFSKLTFCCCFLYGLKLLLSRFQNSHEVAEITGRASESLPPTPPYSVSAPNTPTPDTSHTDAQNCDEDEDLSVPPTPATSR